MYIRKARKTDKTTGKSYIYYQLVEAYRTPKGPRQRVLLNLGKLNLDDRERKQLANRIEELITGQRTFIETPEEIERLARRFASKLRKEITRKEDKEIKKEEQHWETVDINSIKTSEVRTIGGELIGLWAYDKLGLSDILMELGFSEKEITRAKVLILGKLINPGSELDIYNWFQKTSGLNELMGIKETEISLYSLYRVSDKLETHKDEIEKALVQRARKLFGPGEKLILYDLTNTYFEGSLKGSDLARHGNSKEKRYDSPIVTVGLVLDEQGFPKTSRIFAGNVGEPSTLSKILDDLLLNPPTQLKLFQEQMPTVVIDAGIVSKKNLDLIKSKRLNYISVDRQRVKELPDGEPEVIHQKDGVIIKAIKVDKTDEVLLYCISEGRAKKEQSIKERFKARFEKELDKIKASLGKKGGVKRYEKDIERIGRLKERYSRVAHFYDISVRQENGKAVEITWKIKEPDQMETAFSGSYCIRTSRKDLSEKELWSIYHMLSTVEASFRSLKSDLSIRPIYHRIDKRIKGHIFTTILAYHLLCVIQKSLHTQKIYYSWKKIRKFMRSHVRLTTTMTSNTNKTIYLRIASQPEEFHMDIYNALGISLSPLKRIKKIR